MSDPSRSMLARLVAQASDPLREVEGLMGGYPSALDGTKLVKPAGLKFLGDQPVIYHWQNKGWAIRSATSTEEAARKIGEKVQKELVGKKLLTYSDPYLHQLPLYVIYRAGWVEIGGAVPKVKVKTGPSITEQKDAIINQGERFFGQNSIKILGTEGKYRLSITPKLREHKIFRPSVIETKTLAELGEELQVAIDRVTAHLAK